MLAKKTSEEIEPQRDTTATTNRAKVRTSNATNLSCFAIGSRSRYDELGEKLINDFTTVGDSHGTTAVTRKGAVQRNPKRLTNRGHQVL